MWRIEMETKTKSVISSALIAISVMVAAAFVGIGLMNFRSTESHTIAATGSASTNFESDLIVWRGNYSAHADTSAAAYTQIEREQAVVKGFLQKNGVKDSEMSFSAVNVYHATRDVYDADGNYRGQEYDGYDLSQSIVVTSSDLDVVEKVSTDVSSLLSSGIEFTSDAPEYYYTKLDDLKLELIDAATENARQRVNIIAEKSGAKVGKLTNSNLGVFQITAQNTGTSSYSYDGYVDTSSRQKTATITVRLEYGLK